MTLKAVLFDFNGVIMNDEPIHDRLIGELLLGESLRPDPKELAELCLGRSDRACLNDLFERRSRVLSDRDLDRLLAIKAAAYQAELSQMERLPIYAGLEDLIYRCRVADLKLAVVSGARRAEVELVLERTGLRSYFSVLVTSDDVPTSKPDPGGYLLAIEQLRQFCPELQAENCLAIEDSFAGIEAAKRARISVVGVASTYPFHMIQRQANWAIDYINDLELERVQRVFAGLDGAEPPEPISPLPA
ncbi:MAG: HAD family phosphatase [Synechococcales cyanobacterium CRU_2_2]|nr:HAD family phosphatase [Synechococcales cyanobacterium CRU_2_2]